MQTISTQAKLAILKENEAQLRFYGASLLACAATLCTPSKREVVLRVY
jgi:hypothetical protein